MTVAAVDRLVHHATIIEIQTESFRRQKAVETHSLGERNPAGCLTPLLSPIAV